MIINSQVKNSERKAPGERLNWGSWIVLSFVLFTLFIGALVTICVRQDIGLVSPDYYRQELDYQKQIERKQNAEGLHTRPQFAVIKNQLTVSYSNFKQVKVGELKLLRPSDARLDQTFNIQSTDDGIQTFDISTQQHGMYKVSLTWTMSGKEYFVEETIYF